MIPSRGRSPPTIPKNNIGQVSRVVGIIFPKKHHKHMCTKLMREYREVSLLNVLIYMFLCFYWTAPDYRKDSAEC